VEVDRTERGARVELGWVEVSGPNGYPTRAQLARYVTALRQADWVAVERRLAAALQRERAGTVASDGWGRGRDFNARGGTTLGDPTGSASLGRLTPPGSRADPHAHLTRAALRALTDAVEAKDRLVTHLTALTSLITHDDDQVPECEPCRAGGIHHPAVRWGDVGGRLPEPVNLCLATYEYVRRHGALPAPADCARHDASGRWRVRIP
jgi:hypothetical protein